MAIRGSTHFLALALLIVIGINMLCNFHGVTAQFCQGAALSEIATICGKSVVPPGPEVPPSSECCSAMQIADIPCLCKLFTKEIEGVMSPKKVVDVARSCGVTVSAGLQCGSPPKYSQYKYTYVQEFEI
ncbi:uncharacterized protein LOC114717763 [Neltuma alba]|uniref:uncharacterized protein LOC114717763 n=1 Tax=Neltuma alba TaxID=207710 RepID=UPI0010A3969E|nr:uncharacterized protein LOC114717763 [Prosopis alba]